MRLPRILIGICAVTGTLLGIAATPPLRIHLRPPASTGTGHLQVFGSRGAASLSGERHDALLADLVRHAALVRPEHALADLHALSPAARFTHFGGDPTPYILIDATSRGDPGALGAALSSLGLRHVAIHANDVGGWLPVGQVSLAARLPELAGLRAALPHRRAGAVTTQGDYAQRSDLVRTADPTLTGAGVTVGVLSDSYDCYAVYAQPGSGVPASGLNGYAYNGYTADAARDIATGDLPASVNVVSEADCASFGAPIQLPYSDEGRAMLQIVHDVAPGASLAFHTAFASEADFANGIAALAGAGATVVLDDVGYYDEPYYQDGLLAQAVDAVAAKGVAYFSAAGNNAAYSYENGAPSFATVATGGPQTGERLLNFDPSGTTTTTALPVTIPALAPGDFVAVILHWDQPYVTGSPGSPGSSNSLDLCVSGSGADTITDLDGNAVSCTGPSTPGGDPYQVIIVGNPANAAGNSASEAITILVGLAGGPTPGRVKLTVDGDGLPLTMTTFATMSPTLQGHAGAAGALTVGAAFYFDTPRCATTPATLESYSSRGGEPILFDTAGNRLATPVVRHKPDLVGPDGGNDTFLGYTLASQGDTGPDGLLSTSIAACQNHPDYPNFFGTSAATPHVAGIATLMRQSNPALTPTQIYDALRTTALAMSPGSAPSFDWGSGFVQADAALAALPPAPPGVTLTLAPASVTVGTPSKLSWAAANATACVASGAWSGTQALSGTQSIATPTVVTQTYTLACSNATGTTTKSATLTVAAAPASGGGSSGGGALGPAGLVELAALALLARFRQRRARS